MTTCPIVSAELVAEVVAIASDAGRAILRIYADVDDPERIGLVEKDDASPLTQADLVAHNLICARLMRLTPGIAVVSEEGRDCNDATHDAYWLIDPLDGTKEFINRNGEFTVNIALIQEQAPVFGVVVAPVLGRSYWGGRHLGAFCDAGNGPYPIRVASTALGGAIRVVASKSHDNDETRAFVSRLGPCESMAVGSSLKFCLVAEGSADVYPRLGPTRGWDTAAAHAVVEGAGGWVVTLSGDRLSYAQPSELNPHFVATARAPHELPGWI